MKPKEALLKDGTIPVKEGKGRLSREAIERCKWLVAEKGWHIEGYSVDTAAPKSTAAPVVKKEAIPGQRFVDYLFPSDFRFPEGEYKAVEVVSKKEHGMRECCNLCKVSLTNHFCDNPTIHENIAVKIVPL
jgi:hypothetical protein